MSPTPASVADNLENALTKAFKAATDLRAALVKAGSELDNLSKVLGEINFARLDLARYASDQPAKEPRQ